MDIKDVRNILAGLTKYQATDVKKQGEDGVDEGGPGSGRYPAGSGGGAAKSGGSAPHSSVAELRPHMDRIAASAVRAAKYKDEVGKEVTRNMEWNQKFNDKLYAHAAKSLGLDPKSNKDADINKINDKYNTMLGHAARYIKATAAERAKGRNEKVAEAVLPDLKKLPATDPTKQSDIDEDEGSNKSWASVDKSKLPAACFLWVEDPEKKATWHLPYREGAGEINAETGMYSKAGAINLGAVRAIQAALGGARSGKAMNVPAEVKAKAEALAKRFKIGAFADAKEAIKEAFVALGDALEDAVVERWPDRYILYDFSNESAILRVAPKPMNSGDTPNDDYDKYFRVGYKLADEKIEFDGEPMEVRQVIDYV